MLECVVVIFDELVRIVVVDEEVALESEDVARRNVAFGQLYLFGACDFENLLGVVSVQTSSGHCSARLVECPCSR